MYDVVRNYHDYSVLGHMDLIKRYDDKDGYDAFNEHKEIITRYLNILLKMKGIELNTSSVRYGLDDLMPSVIFFSYITILGKNYYNSDSHEKVHLVLILKR